MCWLCRLSDFGCVFLSLGSEGFQLQARDKGSEKKAHEQKKARPLSSVLCVWVKLESEAVKCSGLQRQILTTSQRELCSQPGAGTVRPQWNQPSVFMYIGRDPFASVQQHLIFCASVEGGQLAFVAPRLSGNFPL